jgi:hypothetical protein
MTTSKERLEGATYTVLVHPAERPIGKSAADWPSVP